jgi:hypothetical protein
MVTIICIGNIAGDGQVCYSSPLTHSFVLQVMVAALKFFLGSDPENEKLSDDSDSDVIFLYILYLSFSLYAKCLYSVLSN